MFYPTQADLRPEKLGCDDYLLPGPMGCCMACCESGPLKSLPSVYLDGCAKCRQRAAAGRASAADNDKPGINKRILGTHDRPDDDPLYPESANIRGSHSFRQATAGVMDGKPLPERSVHCDAEFTADEPPKIAAPAKKVGLGTAAKAMFSITMLFGLFCPHSFFITGSLVEQGEAYSYAICAMLALMRSQGCAIDFAWYD